MQLLKASRKQAKIRMALQGPSGSGKTMSALLLAYGLCGQWNKIAIIDSESHSADLYANLGAYNVLSISAPFTPEKYIEAIQVCEKEGMEVIIIDSISQEWDGIGGILDIHSGMSGNSFVNWGKLTPRHNAFVQAFLQSKAHIIGTIRSKQDYVLVERNGKQVPEKVGLKGITRDGMDYEFTLVFDLNIKHKAIASKDRTSLFMGKPECRLTTEVGTTILNWCSEGVNISVHEITNRIGETKSIKELFDLYRAYPQFSEALKPEFERRKRQILINQEIKDDLNNLKTMKNGTE